MAVCYTRPHRVARSGPISLATPRQFTLFLFGCPADHGSDNNNTENAATVDAAILQGLENACRACRVSIDRYGTFGGNHRGILSLYPAWYRQLPILGTNDKNDQVVGPLIPLQGLLEQHFPDCSDQRKGGGVYNPHMTVSHFIDLPAAFVGKPQKKLGGQQRHCLGVPLGEIYISQRTGDNGQIERLVWERLVKRQCTSLPLNYVHMPIEEGDWVRDERMQLKSRRNGANKRRNGQGGRGASSQKNRQGRGRSSPRVADAPEVIEAKSAARKTKREALDAEATNASDSYSDSSLSE